MHRAMEPGTCRSARQEPMQSRNCRSQLQTDLSNCQAAAATTKRRVCDPESKYPVRRKPGQFTIPPAVSDQAAKMLEEANAACQQTYEARLKTGS